MTNWDLISLYLHIGWFFIQSTAGTEFIKDPGFHQNCTTHDCNR